MTIATTSLDHDEYDDAPDFVYAVSLLAALEASTELHGHAAVLPFLGMARAALTDFGQRRPARYVDVHVPDLQAGLADLDRRLCELHAESSVLQQTLRIDAARRLLLRGIESLDPERSPTGG